MRPPRRKRIVCTVSPGDTCRGGTGTHGAEGLASRATGPVPGAKAPISEASICARLRSAAGVVPDPHADSRQALPGLVHDAPANGSPRLHAHDMHGRRRRVQALDVVSSGVPPPSTSTHRVSSQTGGSMRARISTRLPGTSAWNFCWAVPRLRRIGTEEGDGDVRQGLAIRAHDAHVEVERWQGVVHQKQVVVRERDALRGRRVPIDDDFDLICGRQLDAEASLFICAYVEAAPERGRLQPQVEHRNRLALSVNDATRQDPRRVDLEGDVRAVCAWKKLRQLRLPTIQRCGRSSSQRAHPAGTEAKSNRPSRIRDGSDVCLPIPALGRNEGQHQARGAEGPRDPPPAHSRVPSPTDGITAPVEGRAG